MAGNEHEECYSNSRKINLSWQYQEPNSLLGQKKLNKRCIFHQLLLNG